MNADVGLVGVVTVPPAPAMMVQVPDPTVGVFPAKVADVPQMVWSGPAFAVVGFAVRLMTTSSKEAVHGAFVIVQRRV